MSLNNTEIRYYDSNVLRLPAEKRKEYHEQVDRLVTELSKRLKDQSEIKITKVVKAGSFAKYTILRKTSEDPVDVDVVFYISGRSVDKETLASLGQLIYDALIKLYPNKAVEDFEIQRKAATVTFVGSGLSVDIVPVIEDIARPDYGWQFSCWPLAYQCAAHSSALILNGTHRPVAAQSAMPNAAARYDLVCKRVHINCTQTIATY